MRIREDTRDSGGIEGLPLQLMIIILVATMGTAIIVGWMGSIETPHAIGDVQYDGTVEADDDGTLDPVTITVLDQDGNLLEGATVLLSGMNVEKSDGSTAYAITGDDGSVTFEDLKITKSSSLEVGFLKILVTKSGYTDSSEYRITVIM